MYYWFETMNQNLNRIGMHCRTTALITTVMGCPPGHPITVTKIYSNDGDLIKNQMKRQNVHIFVVNLLLGGGPQKGQYNYIK